MFSLLQNSISHQQRSSLEDYISVSVMLQYNRKLDILSVYILIFFFAVIEVNFKSIIGMTGEHKGIE